MVCARVLGFDTGTHLGWGLCQFDGPVSAGTVHLPGSLLNFGLTMDSAEREIIRLVARFKPDLIMLAEPWIRHFPPVTVAGLKPVLCVGGAIEQVAYRRGIECREENESRVRGYFMNPMPRGTAAIKRAAIQVCRDRSWMVTDDHAADALLMAAYGLAVKNPDRQHELLPMYCRRKAKVA